jgi:hypothetical protein
MMRADFGSGDERRLVRLFRGLRDSDREALFAFAEFLRTRGLDASQLESAAPPQEPMPEPRPPGETVVGAIKRLRRVYPMLDGSKMLHETSTLMAAHVLQGRQAAEVIDELEVLFETRWIEHRDTTG